MERKFKVEPVENNNIEITIDDYHHILSCMDFIRLAGRISAMKDQILDDERKTMYPDKIKPEVDCPF